MGRTIEISGAWLVYLFYTVSLAVAPLFFSFAVLPIDDVASVFFTGLLALVVAVVLLDLWYWTHNAAGEHLTAAAKRNVYDITHDRFADPGQAAKDYWQQAVRRLPDDEE